MHLAFPAVVVLLVALSPMGRGIEIVTQQTELSSSAQVTPVNGGQGGTDQASRSNFGRGDRSLETITATSFEGVNVHSSAAIEVRRTNSASAEIFEIASNIEVDSEDFVSQVTTQLNTRATANVFHLIQVRSETPFRYNFRKSGVFSLAGTGSFTISTSSGTVLLNHSWINGTREPAESTGTLPSGTYSIGFSEGASVEGFVSPAIVNHISGFSDTTVSITLTPVQVEPTPPPALELRRDGAGHLVLKLTNLRPGTYYTIERSDGLQPNSWNFLVSLLAAGSEVVWTDTFNVHTATTFYRLRY